MEKSHTSYLKRYSTVIFILNYVIPLTKMSWCIPL